MSFLRKVKTSFILLVFTFLSISAEHIELQFTQISNKDGLSQNTVRDILQDRKGFIWAGTLDGLNRYDGYRILTYKPQIGEVNSLNDHRIRTLYEDKDGYLWVKTYKNIFSCYDPVSDSFINYDHANNGSSISYHSISEAKNGEIWLWGVEGCLRIRKNKGKWTSDCLLKNIPSGKKLTSGFFFEDSKGLFWYGNEYGLYRINGDKTDAFFTKGTVLGISKAVELNGKIYFSTDQAGLISYDIRNQQFDLNSGSAVKEPLINLAKAGEDELLIVTVSGKIYLFNTITHHFATPSWMNDPDLGGNIQLIIDKQENVWIFNHSGYLWLYRPEEKGVRKLHLIPKEMIHLIDEERYNILIDSQNTVWITTYGNGLFSYHPENGQLQRFPSNQNRTNLNLDFLLSITEDNYGNIWLGSEYSGIIKAVKRRYNIHYINPEPRELNGKSNSVRTICEASDGTFWMGTKNGSLYIYNADFSKVLYTFKDLNPYSLQEDAQGRIWVGTKGNGIYVYDLKSHRLLHHFVYDAKDTGSLSNNSIFSLLLDREKRVWVGSFAGGINLVEEKGGRISFRRFFENEGNRSYIRCLWQDHKGDIWAGSSDGILRFNPRKLLADPKAFKNYQMNLHQKNSLTCNDIKTIYEDKSHRMWIGTAGGGLYEYKEAKGQSPESFVAYTMVNGLSGDVITGVLEDNKGNLWIGTENGISEFDLSNHSFRIYHFSEKIFGNHFNENANILCRNKTMLWGTLDGLLAFNPVSFIHNTATPPVTLTDFFLYDQRVVAGEENSPLKQSIGYSKEIFLNYKQNTFTIEFAALTLEDPGKNKYTYKLEPYDPQWSVINNDNTATYKNLAPGKYIFKVRGSNSDGTWHKEATTLLITITPPWWKSPFAYVVYFLLALLALYIVLRLILKFNTLNNNIQIEKELTNHKLRFFTNISHEFRTPLTLIRGAVEKLDEQKDLSDPVRKQIHILNRNSVTLTRLIDQLLEFRKIQNNVLTLNLEKLDIVSFAEEIASGFKELAAQKEIELAFSPDTASIILYIDRSKVDKILYNLLSNAFKFTPKGGRIELMIQEDANARTCRIAVKDNGIGVEKEKQSLLFSRFMQIHFSSSGTGVGLSLVKEFVEVHKGRVWYEENEGQGSIFSVELSTDVSVYKGANFVSTASSKGIDEEVEPEVISPAVWKELKLQEPDNEEKGGYRMLIIDDNDDIRNFLIDEFGQYFKVDVAENGKIGLEKAIEHNPDLIICDVMMPEMDGFEVTHRLKEDFQTCHIPIILLTAHSSLEHQLEGIESGADAYIMKPFSLKYLVVRVFKLIEQREQLKKRFSNEYVLDGNLIASTDKDKEFIERINLILDTHLAESSFSVDQFAELANLRRTLFYKKVKGLTGMSPNDLIKLKRLKVAAELLLKGDLTVSEIAYKVGFEDPFYFSKCFKAQYKTSPSRYGQKKEDIPSEGE